jgi:hypothetical protein
MDSGLNPADPTLVAAFRRSRYRVVRIQTIDVPLQYGSAS